MQAASQRDGEPMKKYVYPFAEGNVRMRDLLGGKGANLCEMTRLGLPVPPGFVITTEACNYYARNQKFPPGLKTQLSEALTKIERKAGKRFGDVKEPLLLSVRSGSKFSMPGMMDTVLNIGLNDETVQTLARMTGSERFALDAYRRLISMFGRIVKGIDGKKFESILDIYKAKTVGGKDTDLDAAALKAIIVEYKALYRKAVGSDFPSSPGEQLDQAIVAVFKSWTGQRAVDYRNIKGIPHDLGTAANIQAMVFGNIGTDSATGVGFTRDPGIGIKEFFAEYLTNAQGEDVVAGIRTPKPISELRKEMPRAYAQLRKVTAQLEKHYRDIQDFEFTIERGRLFMLQTRTGQRTGIAALRIAVDMVHEKLITRDEAIMRVNPGQHIPQILAPIFDRADKDKALSEGRLLAKGIAAGPGAASGRVMFTATAAIKAASEGPVILVREETSPDDVKGMHASKGVLTGRGGQTSHAAVVARGSGIPTIVGCEAIRVDEGSASFVAAGKTVKEGDDVSIDGFTGEVLLGRIDTKPSEILQVLRGGISKKDSELYRYWDEFMGWTDRVRKLGVRANADVPEDAKNAMLFGAEGIGLCRTEHMFFAEERLPFMQEMIIADNEVDRRRALSKLLPFQREDFKGLFREMEGHSVTIRTLDPPLHEFLPKTKEDAETLSRKIGVPVEKILTKSNELHEFNPMLGHRGCRLGITYPEITEMQAEAIISAACELKKEGVKVMPEIMIPLVGFVSELVDQKKVVDETARRTMAKYGVKLDYKVGTMIEVPRAAVTAGEIAKVAEFFSFGTNDLTQMALGFSRDDSGKFTRVYLDKSILKTDPFESLDQIGVGELVKMATESGRRGRRNLKVGICGEHGGDPSSIEFCHEIGLDYVSCSPFRVPVARLAAAQANLRSKGVADRGV